MLKNTLKLVKENKLFLLRLGLMGYVAIHVVSPDIAMASTTIDADLPFATGAQKIYSTLTGPLAQIGAGIAVAVGSWSWMQGESQIGKTATRVCLGSGCILAAPTLVNTLAGSASGALF